MHRIDAADYAPGNLFTDGSPGVTPATECDDDWLNGVQETICDVIEDAGITLVKGTNTQLTQAIKARKGCAQIATDGVGGVQLAWGRNVTSVALNPGNLSLDVTTSESYNLKTQIVTGSIKYTGPGVAYFIEYEDNGANKIRIRIKNTSGTVQNLSTLAITFSIRWDLDDL